MTPDGPPTLGTEYIQSEDNTRLENQRVLVNDAYRLADIQCLAIFNNWYW